MVGVGVMVDVSVMVGVDVTVGVRAKLRSWTALEIPF